MWQLWVLKEKFIELCASGSEFASLHTPKVPCSSSPPCWKEEREGVGGKGREKEIVGNHGGGKVNAIVASGQREKQPNQQRRTVNKLPTELRRRNFVDNHRLSTQVGAKRAKNVCATCACIPTELPFLHATVGGWESRIYCILHLFRATQGPVFHNIVFIFIGSGEWDHPPQVAVSST